MLTSATELGLDKTKGKFTAITLHHTGSETTPQEVEALHRDHESAMHWLGRAIASLGRPPPYDFADVGYNFMVAPDGTIYEGRPLQYEAAHVFGKNTGNIGIAFLGNYAKALLSDAQISSANALIKQLNSVYNISSRSTDSQGYIYTHGQFDAARPSELAGAAAQIQALKKNFYGR